MPEQPRRSEIAAEQRFVDSVHRHLDAARARVADLRREGRVRGQAGPPGGLVERDALAWWAQRRQDGLDAAEDGLVFGRLDHTDGTSLHLGRVGLRDEQHRTLLVDWRAPAAAAFYQATPGDPRGLRRRRVIRCAGRRVVDLDDDVFDAAADELPLVGEGALRRRRGPRMRDIVATIQREQDAAIRAPGDGLTEITGGPGTGKTQVALHRAAYLLYRDRRRLDAGRVLVVGPSAVFTSYIGAVLPGLGEDSVVLRALGDLVDGVRATRRDAPAVAAVKGSTAMPAVLAALAWQPPPGAPQRLRIVYAGQVLTVDADTLAAVRARVRAEGVAPNAGRARAGTHLVDALWQDLVAAAVPGLSPRPDLFAQEVADRPELHRFLDAWWPVLTPAGVLGRLGDPDRVARAARGVLDAAAAAALSLGHRGGQDPQGHRDGHDWSVADVALLDELDELLGRPPGRRAAPAADGPAELDTWAQRTGREGYLLSRGLSGGWSLYVAGDPMPLAETGPDFDDAPVVARRWARRVIASAGERVTGWMAGQDPLGQPGFAAVLEGEDPTEEDGDAPPPRGYAHIVVDEAQDLSPMQWRMLGRRSARAGWTVVGDPAQSLWPDPDAARAARDAAVGVGAPAHRYVLRANYRTSAEIFAVAARVLAATAPRRRPPRAVRRTGVDPRLQTVDEAALAAAAAAAAGTMLEQVEGTVAVLVPPARAGQVAGWLSALGDPRLTVLDAVDAKGLEYDAVLLVQPAEVAAAAGWSTLYVALTRATVRLWVLGTGADWLPQAR